MLSQRISVLTMTNQEDINQLLYEQRILHLFPKRKNQYVKALKSTIQTLKQVRDQLRADKRAFMNFNPPAWATELYEQYILELDQRHESAIKRVFWQIRTLNRTATDPQSPGRITEADVAAAKRTPLPELYAGQLRRAGGQRLTGPCPFHKERTGSFTIYLSQNSFYCYGCTASGDVIAFVMKQQNIKFLEAVKFLLHDPDGTGNNDQKAHVAGRSLYY